MNFNGIERRVKNGKNSEKDRKFFGNVLKIWGKNTCEIVAFLETLHAAIIFQRVPYVLRKWLIL